MIRQIARDNAILLVQYAVASLIPLLLMPHIVGVIGLAEYGKIAVILAWSSYGAVIVQYAFHMTGPKRMAQLEASDSRENVFIEITLAKTLLLLWLALAIAVTTYYLDLSKTYGYIIWPLLLTPPIAAAMNSVWFLQTQNKFFSVCILAVSSAIITLAVGLICIRKNNSHALEISAMIVVLGLILNSIGTFVLALPLLNRRAQTWNLKWRLKGAITSIKEGWHLFLSQFIAMLYSLSGPIVINYLVDAKQAGAYSVTERAIGAFMSAALLTHTAAYPRLALIYRNDRAQYKKLLKLILVSYFFISLLLLGVGLTLIEKITIFLYAESGEHYHQLLIFSLIWLCFGIFGPVLTGYLTVSGQSSEVWPLTLKILFSSFFIGVPAVMLFGSSGWIIALILSQGIVIITGLKHWKNINER